MPDEMYPETEARESEEVREDGVETTLVPKSMFPKASAGDTIRVKVVATLEDELEVQATKSKSEKEDSEDKEGGTMESRMAVGFGDE